MDDFDDAIRKITQVYPPACDGTFSVGETRPVGLRSLPTELLPNAGEHSRNGRFSKNKRNRVR